MRITAMLFIALALIVLASCGTTKETVSTNATTVCTQCGDSCVPESLRQYTTCTTPTRTVTCVFEDNKCTVAE
jgi:hypothetical protein